MDLFTAKKLTALRKYHSLSQEALAEKAGVSRQAVSKWERGEASPDTDNLLTISKIYNVSVDDLLGDKNADEIISGLEMRKNGDIAPETAAALDTQGFATEVVIIEGPKNDSFSMASQEESTEISEKLFHDSKEEKSVDKRRRRKEKKPPLFPTAGKKLLKFPFVLVAIISFVLLGFLKGLWHPSWLIFLLVPLYYLSAAAFFAPTKKKILLRLPIYYFAITAFLFMGILWGLWAYAWLIFLFVPLYYWLVSLIKNK